MSYIIILKGFLGIVIALSGILKLFDLKSFYRVILKIGFFRGSLYILNKVLAYSLPFIEIIVGILLLLNTYIKTSSFILLLMFIVSLIGVCYAYWKHKKIENCGCWGNFIKVPINKWKIFENIIWQILSLILFLMV